VTTGPSTPTRTDATDDTRARAPRPDAPRGWGRRIGFAVVLLAVAWAWGAADLELFKLLRAPDRLLRLFGLMFFPPNPAYLGRAFGAMVESLQMAWLGTLMAAALSLPLSLLAAKNVSGTVGSSAARQVLNAIRAFPELVLVVLLVTITGLGAVTGTLALGLHSIGTLGKLSSEAVEGIDRGPIEAVEAVGGTWLQRMRWGVLPQALPEIVAFWLYRFEINIRASAVLGVIGAGGIGAALTNTLSYRHYRDAGTAFIVVVVVTLIVDTISSRIRQRIISGAPSPMAVEADAVAAGEM
jgi:phosphonate transport system permease protein